MTASALLVVLIVTSGAQLPAGLVPGWLHDQSDTYQAIWPQRWQYFATSDGLATTVVYRPAGAGRAYAAAIAPLTSADNLWGISRREYALLVEAASIESRIPAGYWRSCDAPAVAGCAGPLATVPPLVLDNHAAWPPLCGEYVFAHERPGSARGRRVVAVARVTLTC